MYTMSFAATGGVLGSEQDSSYQCSLCQKMEYHCGEQEGSGCQ